MQTTDAISRYPKNYVQMQKEDPLYIERSIKEEIVTDSQNEIPYFEFYECPSFDSNYDNPVTANICTKLEEKFKIAIDKVHSSHYKHFIQFYCTKCQSTTDVHFRKYRNCRNVNCSTILKYQCILCGKLFKHYTGAYMHVKKNNCENSNKTVKTEIKTELITKCSKKYNPYHNKIRKNGIRNKNTCPKCLTPYKNGAGFAIHFKYCGLKRDINCSYCPYKCKLEAELTRHMKKHVKLE
ncbi:hypothetical protein TSAR_016377 [Trichomalopsis sarcophagae]|uniref:C2H2-type domain-containing protein n=1 Tax=Trichomalopsis sarcophagae TaxID=543379 RepID=A0A232F3E2_9HYME|nr:hypothetical protein TSAR_016377 [Trichomalopsis sarcophagae]